MRWAALALLASLLAGCALDEAPRDADRAPAAPRAYAAATPEFALSPDAGARTFPLALRAEGAWAKPLDVVPLDAVPSSAAHAWFVGLVGGRVHVTYVDDVPYLTDADAPRAREADGRNVRQGPTVPRGGLDSGDVAPGSGPATFVFPAEGRYRLVGPAGGAMNVTVLREATATSGSVRMRSQGGATTFDPAEVEVAPGAAVLFLNVGASPARALLAASMVRLDEASAGARVAPVDEGEYRVALVARDASGARGVAEARIVSDFDRPSAREVEGPYTGTFLCGGASPCDDARAYPIDARFPIRELLVNLSVGSATGASLAVRVVHEGVVLASGEFDDAGSLRVLDVPRGASRVEVEAGPGALVSYALRLEMRYALPPPP